MSTKVSDKFATLTPNPPANEYGSRPSKDTITNTVFSVVMPRAFISTVLVAKKLDELPNVMAEAPEQL
jgi:hypothetical protein